MRMGLGGRLALPQLAGIDQLKDHSESRLMDRRQELVARRIEELRASNERKAEMAGLTRDELIYGNCPTQPVLACQGLARLTASRLLRCWP